MDAYVCVCARHGPNHLEAATTDTEQVCVHHMYVVGWRLIERPLVFCIFLFSFFGLFVLGWGGVG